ncbi:hypothetical protein [Mahella sp.]|uniref:hypothetical protein n=1 Tax=Mahella sp. TaxID=2798721 RepID=UPI0025BE3BDD|nr:hypothetical protein [Mahella sp.]MBZ4664798.1 hypothetical protein [Mahella sp.]
MTCNRQKAIYFLLICMVAICCFSPNGAAQAADQQGKVYAVVLDRVAMEDLIAIQPPNIMHLIDQGTIALMNTKVAGSRNPKSAYITIGAGVRATYAGGSHLAFNASELYNGEIAANRYKQSSGISTKWDQIVNLSMPQLIRNNANQDHDIYIGELGRILRLYGIKTAVLGNEDTDDVYSRNVVSLIMDEEGKVPLGDVSKNVLVRDVERPYSLKTDYQKLWNETQWFSKQSDVLFIQTGDTYRADEFRQSTTDAMLTKYRHQAIMEADAFIGRLSASIDLDKDMIMIITPYPSAKALAQSNSLTPFIAVGKDVSHGWATSSTTKRAGVITNLDIAPTILRFFDIPTPTSMLGHNVDSVPTDKTPDQLLAFNDKLVTIYRQRPTLIQMFIGFQLIVLLTAFAMLQFKKEWSPYALPFLYSITFMPIAFLLMSLWQRDDILWTVIGLAAVTSTMTYISMKSLSGWIERIALSSLVTAAAIILDMLFNSASLMQGSALGYDVIAGSRYYGIGNEFMGVLIASVIVGTMALAQKYTLHIWIYILPILYAGVFYILISPNMGTNVGGSIAAFMGFGMVLMLMWGFRINLNSAAAVAGSLIVILIAVFYMDSLRSVDMQSHIGQTADILREQGIISLVGIAARKISRNIYLIRYTIWSPTFIASFAILMFLIYRPVGVLKDVLDEYPVLANGFKSAIVASIVAFLVNDSGVVAAAMAMIYVAPFLIALIIRRYGGDSAYEH